LARRLTHRETPRLSAIEIDHASVRLGRHWALRDVRFELRAGQRWLLSGPNGAGKTVFLKLLRGDVWPTPTGAERRRYRLGDEWQDQPLEARERIAYLGSERQDRYDRHGLDARVADVVATGLTGEDRLLETPTVAQWRAVRDALVEVGLAGLAERRFLTLSHGQRRRILLARCLVGRPDVLLLDEALDGLDAASRRAFLRVLRGASLRNAAWVVSTHRPSERPGGVTHVARLEAGRLRVAATETAAALARSHRRRQAIVRPSRRASSRTAQAAADTPLVSVAGASVFRDQRRVLGPLDWAIGAGEHWHVAGPNGAGKSTLIALLYGDLAPATGGRITRRGLARGQPLIDWKHTAGLVSPELQACYAATACTAAEIVVSGLHSSIGLNLRPTKEELARARRWLVRLGLDGLAQRRARELSYGQLRRVLVARALVAPRRLLLLDEPFDGLDAQARRLVSARLWQAVRRGSQIVIATHHMDDVPRYVTRRLTLPAMRGEHARVGAVAA